MDTVNTELIRGHVDTIILNSLVERDRYGYEILDIISNLSEGRYEIKQPTLYSCLKRLEKQGFISSYFGDETQGGRHIQGGPYPRAVHGTCLGMEGKARWNHTRAAEEARSFVRLGQDKVHHGTGFEPCRSPHLRAFLQERPHIQGNTYGKLGSCRTYRRKR